LWKKDCPSDGANLLTNDSFETGDPPSDWSLTGAGATVSRSNVQSHTGTYSALLTRSGADCRIEQNVTSPTAYRGVTLTAGCWVYATVADRARVGLGDTTDVSFSSYHTGVAGWEWLTVTKTISATTAALYVRLYVITGDTSAYFDDVKLSVRDAIYSDDAIGHSGTVTGSIWTPQGRYFDGTDDVIDFGDKLELDITGQITLIATARFDRVSGLQYLIGRDNDAGSRNYGLFTNVAGVNMLIRQSSVSKVTATSQMVTVGDWWVGGTYDGAHVLAYVNGMQDGTPVVTTGAIDNLDVSLTVGRCENDSRQFQGVIKTVWVFNRAFNPSEMMAHYIASTKR
jgi:hypothetical protein